jgi:hypothetical protein
MSDDLLSKVKALESKYRKPKTEEEKRPRHYAEEILALKTREERSAALAKVPDIYRSWVEEYVKEAFWKRKNVQNR